MKYSIIIPTHNHCNDLLKPCIESIMSHTSLLDVEVIVVANGCTDNTKEYIKEISESNKNIKLIWIDDAIGFTKSTNIGINQAKGEFTILLNNDCQILPSQKNQWLDTLNFPFENEKVGMTGIHEIFSEETKQNFLVFYCVMIRTDIFKKIGLLDEVFSPGFGEDIDFCARLLKSGYTFVNCDANTQQQERLMVGSFPLYHAGSSTFHDKNHSEDYEKIVKRNIEILKRRYGNNNKKVKYSIVIPTYNRCDELLKPCLESIKRTTDLSDVEVIIVANGCVDNTEEYVNSLGEPFKLFVYKEQLGYTKATNVGLKAAIGEYIILLNNDVVIMPHDNWLNILREPFEKHDRVGMTGPMLFKGVEGQSNDFIMFFCAMTTRNVIDEVGYLDEMFSPGGVEDVDYGLRMKLANYKLIEVPENTEINRSHAMSSGVFPIFHPGGSTVTKEKGWNEILVRNNEILKKKFPEHFHGLDWIEEMNKNKQKVYDCFSFYNELDLLDIRLNELNDVVDYFVISEATETHQGDKKPLYFEENKERYSKYKDKIIHIIVDDFKKYEKDDIKQYWEREQWQRHSLYKGLINCKENDVILISDVDEIPRADVVSRYTGGIKSLEQKLYYYDFNHLANETWKKAKILQYKDIIDSNYIFSSYFRNDDHDCITNAGWHFSYNSDIKGIIKKLQSFSHKEFNSYPFTDEGYINSCIFSNVNLFDNNKLNFVEIDNSYPKCMTNNIELSLHQLMKKEDVSTYEEIFEINVNKIKKEEVEGRIVIDIGGNKGYFSIQCMELGAKETHCFEPVKTIYKKLTEFTKGFKDINIYNLAVSDGSISEVRINDNGAGSNIWDTDSKIESTKCISLVEALKYVKSDGDMILKLDCEGSEFEILLNTPKEVFQKFSHMYIEIHDEMNPNYFQKRALLLSHIKSLGFHIEDTGLQSGTFYQDGSFVPAPVLVYKFKKNEITIDERGSWSGENSKNYHVLDESLSNTLMDFFKKNNYSVYDFGCGVGFYTKKFIENGIKCKGYDGNPDIKNLSDGVCERMDFSEKFQLEKLDVVMSLEVGEHIPEEYENTFLENIHNHNSKYIILSWAIPGQQGLGHVNEKSNEYIKKKIENLGYTNELELENLLRENSDISWFKNSIMVFKKKEKFTIGFINNDIEIQKKWIDPCLSRINKGEYDIISVPTNNHPAKNYNKIIEQSSNKYIILLHQDVAFPDNFLDIIRETIKQKQNFGVLGIAGISQMEDLNRATIYSNPDCIKNVDFFDSCCIVINKDHNIKFNDVDFNELHMYVEDYCMQSIEKGFENFTFLMNSNDFIHHGNTYVKNNKMMWGEYGKYYEKFINKWTERLNRKTFIWKQINGCDICEFISFENYLNQKEIEQLSNQLKFLIVLVNFGEAQLNFLHQTIDEIKTFDSKKYSIDIIVHSNVDIKRKDVQQVIHTTPPANGWMYLPWECRKTIYDNKDKYDLFLYNENDHLYTQKNIDAFLNVTKVLPEDVIAGFMQYEEYPELNMGKFYPAYYYMEDWDSKSVFKIGDYTFAKFSNHHHGGFLVTKKQLHRAISIAGEAFTNSNARIASSVYQIRERCCTDLYDTGFTKVIPISHFDDFLIHHQPNIYYDIHGVQGKKFDKNVMRPALKNLLDGNQIKKSIIISTSNQCELIKLCVEKIKANEDLSVSEIIIIAHGCKDKTVEYVESLGYPFKLIFSEVKLDNGVSIEFGKEAARGEFITIVDMESNFNYEEYPEGWFDDDNIDRLIELTESIPDNGTMIQLGVYKGRSICSLKEVILRKNIKVIAIDVFQTEEKGNFDSEFELNIVKFGLKQNVETLKMSSADALSIVENNSADIIFIDADHEYNSVKFDIVNWRNKLKENGILCGHDYEFYLGVKTAVDELIKDFELRDGIWSCLKNNSINYDKLLEKLKGQDKFIYDEIFDWNTYTCTDEELKDATIIDIGANKGFFSIFAVMHGAKKVYAYEPNKDTFKILCENVKQFKNIIPINIAAHHPDINEVYSVGLDGNSTVTVGNNENSVKCSSLEQIINSKDLQTENLILKIDCEGSEYDILLPCPAESLKKFKIIYYEFHDKMHENNDFNLGMLNKHIENIGYIKTKSPIQVFLGHYNSNGDFVPESVIDTTETGKFIRKEDDYKVYDCFPFFNELDLLEIRLEELYDVVDKFVITEANATHSGKQKPLYLTENLNRFEKYKDKIELRVVDLLSELPKSEMNENWVREHIQRNDSIEYLKSVCKDNDYIIVSDIDEIPRKSAIQKYISDKTNSAGVLLQDRYMYFLNYKNLTTDEPQLNSKIITFKLMSQYGLFDLNGVRYCDKENLMPTYIIENGGWHFTFMGGVDKVIEKVKAFAHQEYNVPEKINNDRMLKIFEDGKDVYDAKTTWKAVDIDDSFPKKIKEFKQEYIDKGWIKTDKKMEIKKEKNLDKKNILCSISTRGRYDTTLPLAIQSVIAQTLAPDALVIFDDNDKQVDLRNIQHYNYLFRMLDEKNISWQIVFGEKKGQHYNHQIANKMGYNWVWRIDDDCVAEPDVLEKLYSKTNEQVGAVGGSILTPPFENVINVTGKIENIKSEPNIQWGYINKDKSVDHLHCSFLYRADIIDYNLSLSKIAHREETLFTYGLKKEGYEVLVTPCVTWHLKNKEGGIRSHKNDTSMFQHDEEIFDSFLSLWDVKSDTKMIVLDNGIGDHYAFKNILPKLREKYEKITIACCFPDVFHDEEGLQIISINDAKNMMNIDVHNIYRFMIDKRWNKGLVQAFEGLYLQ